MKQLLLAGVFAFYCITLSAQKIEVNESVERIAGAKNNALTVIIYETSPDVIEKEVKSFIKEYDAKPVEQDGTWYGAGAVIKKMGTTPVDIYAVIRDTKEKETQLVMAFGLSGEFISSTSHPSEFKVAKDLVQKFATKVTESGIALLIKTQQKLFDRLTDEQKHLEKENRGLHEDIENYKQKIVDLQQKIKKAEEDIETNLSNQDKKKDEVASQSKVLEAAKDKHKIVE